MDKLLQEIGKRSEFLSERLQHECSETSESIRNVSLWQDFVGQDFFSRRVSFDHIDRKRILELAGMPEQVEADKSDWFVWLSDFMNSDHFPSLCYINEGECGPVFISDAFIPVIAYGQMKLQDRILRYKHTKVLTPCFLKLLTYDIVSLSHRCVFPELFGNAGLSYLNNQEKDYNGWYRFLFLKYPVLARLIFEFMVQWVDNSAKIALRLERDEQKLKDVFNIKGDVVAISMGISDRHNGGQSAAIIEWSDGKKIVYKPHSSLSGKEWNILTDKYSLETYRYNILERQGYSYVEFVDYKTASNPDRFYFHSGELLALCMITGASDLHCENIIAHGNFPVVIDTETIANPLIGELAITPEGCGLMPLRKYVDGTCIGDWGGLTSDRKGINVPDVAFQKKYIDCIIDGFKSVMYRHKDISVLSVPLRFVLRDTMTYSQIQAQCLNRKYMTDGFLYSLPIERLSGALDIREDMFPVYRKEQTDMERMDIPYFYSRPMDRGIYSEQGLLVKDFFDMSINEHIEKRITALNNEKEIIKNIDAIRKLLECPCPPVTELEDLLLNRILKKRKDVC